MVKRPSPSHQAKLLADRLGEEAPTYDLVYDVVSRLPGDLVTLAHQGAKAYSNSFDLIYRREAARSNAIWQADHTPLDIELLRSEVDSAMTAKPWLSVILDDYSRAVAGYLQILCLDHQGEPRELPNHGVSQGYRIHRVVANRWQLVKTKGEWMIKARTILPIDGSSEPLEILSQGLNDVLKSRQKEAAHE